MNKIQYNAGLEMISDVKGYLREKVIKNLVLTRYSLDVDFKN